MISLLQNGSVWIDRFSSWMASGIKWLSLAMVLTTLTVVVLRYGFSVGAIPLQEAVLYMHGLVFLLGIPNGIADNSHVRVDLLYSRYSQRTQRLVDLCGHVLFLVPLALFMLFITIPYVQASWRVLEGSPEVGGLPAVFLLKTLLPVAAVCMLLQGISEIIKQAIWLLGTRED